MAGPASSLLVHFAMIDFFASYLITCLFLAIRTLFVSEVASLSNAVSISGTRMAPRHAGPSATPVVPTSYPILIKPPTLSLLKTSGIPRDQVVLAIVLFGLGVGITLAVGRSSGFEWGESAGDTSDAERR